MNFESIKNYAGKGLLLASQIALAGCVAHCPPVRENPMPDNVPEGSYVLKTLHRTYYKLDVNRNSIPFIRDGQRFYEVDECETIEHRIVTPEKTMLIVMDPWSDVGNDLLNKHCEKVYYGKILPLVHKCIELGLPVTVLTNAKDPDGYGYDIYSELKDLKADGKIDIVYHQDTNTQAFADALKAKGIDTLMYCGFCTNMCIIGRPLGIIAMNLAQNAGFRMLFASDAAAAIEYGKSWETQDIHNWVTFALSQWAVELVEVKDMLELGTAKK